jgi:hypothetical protein
MTDGPRWFLQTAGVGTDQDYRWLPLHAEDDPAVPQTVVYQPLGRHLLAELVSEQTPTILLWRRGDRSFVFYADGMLHPDAPARGDYQGRAIRAGLMGIAPADADPAPLLDAAVAALADDLAASLPVRWVASSPVLGAGADRWSPARPRVTAGSTGLPADPGGSHGLPWDRRAAVARELTELPEPGLRAFPADRILLIVTRLLSAAQLAELRPWRALSPGLSHPREFKEDKRRHHRVFPVLAVSLVGAGVLAVAAVLFWVVNRGADPAPAGGGGSSAPVVTTPAPSPSPSQSPSLRGPRGGKTGGGKPSGAKPSGRKSNPGH